MRVKTPARREAILAVAADVFKEMGFEGASMAEISARIGGSKATLYGYFKSKEELFVAVTHGEAKKQMEPALAALDQSSRSFVRSMVHDSMHVAMQHRLRWRIRFCGRPFPSSRSADRPSRTRGARTPW